MKTISTMLREEANDLEEIIKNARVRMKKAPQGTLRISGKKNGKEYYLKKEGERGNGRYISKKNIIMVERLVQKDYDIKLLKLAEERLCLIRNFLKRYEDTNLQILFAKLSCYRRELLVEAVLSEEEYVRRWEVVEYEGKKIAEDAPEIVTEKGELVRSKSEKIIADKLYSLGIPYRYEYPLTLGGGIVVYPDFTILKVDEKKVVYLEHFGRMDDAEYLSTVLYKLHTYERNGIYLGVNLFVTYETAAKPLNTRILNEFLRKLFC